MTITETKKTLKTRDYKDIDVSFLKHPIKKDVLSVIGEDSIIQSLKNLILTNYYERLFQPQLGCNIRKLLFENMSHGISLTMRDVITQTIRNFEPRVALTNVIVNPIYDENRYEITLYYFINNKEEELSSTIFLERLR